MDKENHINQGRICFPEPLGNLKVSKNIFPLMCKVCRNLKSQLSHNYLSWILENGSFKAKPLKPLPARFQEKTPGDVQYLYLYLYVQVNFSVSFHIDEDNLRGKKCKRQPGVILPFPQNE